MMRLLSRSLAAILLLVAVSASGTTRVSLTIPQEVPRTATVEIVLFRAPGINDEGSRWEIAYEFRITTEATLWQAGKQGKFKAGSQERIGELIKEGAIKRMLRAPGNRKIILQFPLNTEIQARLRNQPREPVKFTPGQITPEDIKRSREHEMKAQVFVFYPIINIYDAKLKKNIIISFPQTWDFDGYPQARFEIKVEINNDGSYNVNSSLPTRMRASN